MTLAKHAKTSARTNLCPTSRNDASGRQTVTDLISSALARSREPDPHVIARRLLTKLTPEMREELLLVGLVDRVSRRIQSGRAGGIGATPAPGPSKWSTALRVCVGSDWKLLDDCDLSDLTALAGQHRDLAAKNLARAVEYEALAEQLRASGCATVGEMRACVEDLAA